MNDASCAREPNGDEYRWVLSTLGVPNLFLGRTDRGIRIARLHDVIVERDLVDARAGFRNGQPETFRALLERLFGEPIFKPQTKPIGEP